MHLNIESSSSSVRRRIVKKTAKFSTSIVFIVWLSVVIMASRGILHSLASSSKKSTCLSSGICSTSSSGKRNVGFIMPKLFLGTLGVNGIDNTMDAIHSAISSGYRNFDFAPGRYGTIRHTFHKRKYNSH